MAGNQDVRDSDTTTGAGTTTGTGMNTVGGQTTSGQITGGLGANAVTSGNSSIGFSPPASPGRATPDFGPLARADTDGDTLDDADTDTGSMSTDTAALGGGIPVGDEAERDSDSLVEGEGIRRNNASNL